MATGHTVEGPHGDVGNVRVVVGPRAHSRGSLPPPDVYVYQRRSDCYERNGTHRFLERYVYNRDVFVQFDSAVGTFVAVTELGRVTAKNWNVQGEFLELRRRAVDTVCRHNYELDRGFTLQRRGPGDAGSDSPAGRRLHLPSGAPQLGQSGHRGVEGPVRLCPEQDADWSRGLRTGAPGPRGEHRPAPQKPAGRGKITLLAVISSSHCGAPESCVLSLRMPRFSASSER
ncbi:uncharacterized protein [Saccopteryx bilineata]|uniref:uncharacterized protein isoform X3 n=1 Tax=Saccopteryx bilineata TaxID=59482 RepID=UPI00338FBD7F